MSLVDRLRILASRHVLIIAFAIGSVAVAGRFGLSYYFYGHDGLPIGWDTPHYIGQISAVVSDGFLSFAQRNDFYNFMYAGISSLFVLATGVSPVTVEVFFPIFLSVSLMGVSGYFAKRYLGNTEVAVYGTLLAATWFGLYRVGTDLHPNLLALVLLIATLSLFPPWDTGERSNRVRRYVFFVLIIVLSFIHIETTLFFSFVVLMTSAIHELRTPSRNRSLRIFKDAFPLFLALVPGIILFYTRMMSLVNYSRGNPVFQPPLPTHLWLIYLGFLLPLSIYGLYLLLRIPPKSDSGQVTTSGFLYRAFICIWALTSIGVASVDYVVPALSIFSERALMLFPAPFLAAFGLKAAVDRARESRLLHYSKRTRGIALLSIVAVVFASGWVVTYFSMVPHQKVWISSSEYQKLAWLADNRLPGKPIFVYNDYVDAGGMAVMWDNWVQAIYGDHYSYVGRLDFLLARQETPFKSIVSQTVSSMFLDGILRDGIFVGDTILSHDIVVVEDFYRSGGLKNEYRGILNEINEGIFLVNMQEAEKSPTTRLALYSNVYEELGGWYSIETNWTESSYALEFWDPHPSSPKYVDILLPSASQGQFSLSLRYKDGSASDMVVELNGTLLGRVHYGASGEPKIFTTAVLMSSGVYSLRIVLDYELGVPQYASLDFIEVTDQSI